MIASVLKYYSSVPWRAVAHISTFYVFCYVFWLSTLLEPSLDNKNLSITLCFVATRTRQTRTSSYDKD